MNFIYSFFNQPAIVIGLIAFLGLVLQKESVTTIISGTSKAIIGFLMMSSGGDIIVGALDTLSPAFESAFNVQGVIPNNEALIGIAEGLLGREMTIIMGLGFVFNIILARLTEHKYIFLTGHHVLFMAALLAAVLGAVGFEGLELILVGAFLLGSTMILSPAIVQPYYRQVTGSDDTAMGHFNALSYGFAGWLGTVIGDSEDSTEDLDLPSNISFLRDNVISTALVMIIIYLITFLMADSSVIYEMSGGDSIIMFGIVEALTFTTGFVVVLQGVRMMLAEIIPAFQGISETLVPDSIPALDVPVIFPFAPNAVLIGFAISVLGGFAIFLLLPMLNLPVIIPGLIPLFFVGAGVGVMANATGGKKAVVIASFLNGVALILLPALLLPALGDLGFTNSTFGDTDFAVVGLIISSLNNLLGKTGVYFLVGALVVYFIYSGITDRKEVAQ